MDKEPCIGQLERDSDTTMIIGLSGRKGSGKDTVAAYLMKEHGFERKAFADPLKQSVAALLGVEFSDIEKFKNDDDCVVDLGFQSDNECISNLTFRMFLQRYGTEAHRDIFGQDFWVDLTLPVQGFYPGRAIVVTDVRFANEAARVRELGGLVVRVIRGLSDQDQHRSEVIDFDWDYIIDNDGSFHELYGHVEDMLCHLIDRAEV